MNVTFSNGELKIDMVYLFDQLEDEDRAELARLAAYYSDQYKELEDYVVNGYTSTHFNPLVYKLRIAFLTSEDADQKTKQLIELLIKEKELATAEAEKWREKFFKLYEERYSYVKLDR